MSYVKCISVKVFQVPENCTYLSNYNFQALVCALVDFGAIVMNKLNRPNYMSWRYRDGGELSELFWRSSNTDVSGCYCCCGFVEPTQNVGICRLSIQIPKGQEMCISRSAKYEQALLLFVFAKKKNQSPKRGTPLISQVKVSLAVIFAAFWD